MMKIEEADIEEDKLAHHRQQKMYAQRVLPVLHNHHQLLVLKLFVTVTYPVALSM